MYKNKFSKGDGMAKKKKCKSVVPPIIDEKIFNEQGEIHKKWQAERNAYMGRIVDVLGRMKSARRSLQRYKKKKLYKPLTSGLGYSQKKYEKELKKEIKLIEDIEKESAALLNALGEII